MSSSEKFEGKYLGLGLGDPIDWFYRTAVQGITPGRFTSAAQGGGGLPFLPASGGTWRSSKAAGTNG